MIRNVNDSSDSEESFNDNTFVMVCQNGTLVTFVIIFAQASPGYFKLDF